jgi:hypothetical protein
MVAPSRPAFLPNSAGPWPMALLGEDGTPKLQKEVELRIIGCQHLCIEKITPYNLFGLA